VNELSPAFPLPGSSVSPALQFRVTFFANYAAATKREEMHTLQSLAGPINAVTAAQKANLPWLKLAAFGGARTDKGSLRNDANVLAISGVEADYDGERIPFEEAKAKLEQQGIAAIVYTSPSHTEDTPRWRVLCPLSQEMPPQSRTKLLGRLNGLFSGIFSGESWTLSQSYYYGSVNHNPSHQVAVIDGTPIDLHDDLDVTWMSKPDTGTKTTANGERVAGPMDDAALLAQITTGTSYHEATVRLLGRWARDGVPLMEARERLLDAFDAVFPADRDARWKARRADIDRCLEDIYGKEAKQKDEGKRRPEPPPHPGYDGPEKAEKPDDAAAPTSTLRIINPVSLFGLAVPEREWIVQDWLPVGHVTLLYGDGGTGKTLLTQQLMTSCATNRPWCGLAVLPCRVFGLFCEDDKGELHRRQEAINNAYGVQFSDLQNMCWASAIGDDNLLVTFDSNGRARLTERFAQVAEAAKVFGAKLVVIDTAADTFGGNENDRSLVRQFIGAVLNRLVRDINGAVLLNAHPSRAGMSTTGDLDGGSTGWSNSARARWSLTRGQKDTDGSPAADLDERILTRRKANYAGIGDTIKLRWTAGVLQPVRPGGGPFAAVNQALGAEQNFLALLARFEADGRPLSESRNAGNYAPKVFAKCPDAQGYTKQQFSAAMERLFAAGKIRLVTYGRRGAEHQRLALADHQAREEEHDADAA